MQLLGSLFVLSAALVGVDAAATHGEGAEGSEMGPVAFLWPDDRKWDAKDDNIGPCGSSEGPGNRTIFPLSQGSVALTIADEAYQVAMFIAFANDPTVQSQFVEQVVHNVTEIVPGHQCYKIDPIPKTIKAGTNATIQLEYWSTYEGENDGKNQTFYACADVTFVEDQDFNLQVPCFNVSSGDFTSPGPTTTVITGPGSTSGTSASNSPSAVPVDSPLPAGTADGVIVGVLALGAIGAFIVMRRRNAGRFALSDPIPLVKRTHDGSSVNSALH